MGNECRDIPGVSDITLPGPSEQQFLCGLFILFEDDDPTTRRSCMNRAEKSGWPGSDDSDVIFRDCDPLTGIS
jgi:hypothetical protein